MPSNTDRKQLAFAAEEIDDRLGRVSDVERKAAANTEAINSLTTSFNTFKTNTTNSFIDVNDTHEEDITRIDGVLVNKSDVGHEHKDYAKNDRTIKTYDGTQNSIDTQYIGLMDYSIKGNVVAGQHSGEAESNKIMFRVIPIPEIILMDDIVGFLKTVLGEGNFTYNNGKITIPKDILRSKIIKDNIHNDDGYFIIYNKVKTYSGDRYRFWKKSVTSFGKFVFIHESDNSETETPNGGDFINKPFTKFGIKFDDFYNGAEGLVNSDLVIEGVQVERYVNEGDYAPIEIQLTEPLRKSTTNGSVFDEIKNWKLIRRVNADGTPKTTAVTTSINVPIIHLYQGWNRFQLLNTVKPLLSFEYPVYAVGCLNILSKNQDRLIELISR